MFTVDTYYRAVAVLVMWAMFQSHFSVSVLWMILSVPGRPFHGMNAGYARVHGNDPTLYGRNFLNAIKIMNSGPKSPLDSTIDQGPFTKMNRLPTRVWFCVSHKRDLRQATSIQDAKPPDTTPIKRCLDLLRRQNRFSIWLLAYIAIVTSWPLLGSARISTVQEEAQKCVTCSLFRK
uniref:Uncharacterized protein n=1 Tax=Cannabis sativa TaxID=3483 RepID=A0A803Q3Q4_CANSA